MSLNRETQEKLEELAQKQSGLYLDYAEAVYLGKKQQKKYDIKLDDLK